MGVTNGAHLFKVEDENFIKRYDVVSNTLIDTAMLSGGLIVGSNFIYRYDDYIDPVTDISVRKCDLANNCTVIIPRYQDIQDIAVYTGLTYELKTTKFYFYDLNVSDSANSLRYVDYNTGLVAVDQALTDYMHDHEIPFTSDIMIFENSKYKILSLGQNQIVFDMQTNSLIDSYTDHCEMTDEEIIKKNKYVLPYLGVPKVVLDAPICT
ncbi:MAG: hypothetical protein ACK41T_10005 [Pseudobdellovibrio sp.]